MFQDLQNGKAVFLKDKDGTPYALTSGVRNGGIVAILERLREMTKEEMRAEGIGMILAPDENNVFSEAIPCESEEIACWPLSDADTLVKDIESVIGSFTEQGKEPLDK